MRDLVRKTLSKTNYERIPMLYLNRDKEKSDIVLIHVIENFIGENGDHSEWGFSWNRCDSTMGQPSEGILSSLMDIQNYSPPDPYAPQRFLHVKKMMEKYPDAYYLANMGLSGYTIMSCLRGFAEVLEDMYLDEEAFQLLADKVFDTEEKIIGQLKNWGFHGVAFWDDWGTQESLVISPEKWREFFKPRYQKEFELIHSQGMDVFFHSCGAIESVIPDLIEIGVDMLNIGQPNLFNIEELGKKYGGEICFVCPVSYQTTSISGTKEMIENDVKEYMEHLGCFHGGLIGYIEDYKIMGMSEENYQACVHAFEKFGNYADGVQERA